MAKFDRLNSWYFSILGIFGLILARLFYWQVLAGSQLDALASIQHQSTYILPASRGLILTSDDFSIVSAITDVPNESSLHFCACSHASRAKNTFIQIYPNKWIWIAIYFIAFIPLHSIR